jgi:uncharacterized RDD family membrane protein YckC
MNPTPPKAIKRDRIHATYTRRVFGFLIDFAVFSLFFPPVKSLLKSLPIDQGGLPYALLGFLLLNLFALLYLSIMESSPLHASIGKYCLGMKVVGDDGGPCPLVTALARNAVKLFSCAWPIAILFHFDTIREQLELAVLLSVTTNPVWHDFMAVTDGEKYQFRLVHDQIARTQVVLK